MKLKFKCKTCKAKFTVQESYGGLVIQSIKKCARPYCHAKSYLPEIENLLMTGTIPTLCQTKETKPKVIMLSDHRKKEQTKPKEIPENGVENVNIYSSKAVVEGLLKWKRRGS